MLQILTKLLSYSSIDIILRFIDLCKYICIILCTNTFHYIECILHDIFLQCRSRCLSVRFVARHLVAPSIQQIAEFFYYPGDIELISSFPLV